MEFLREYFYGGIDWHDSYSNTTVVYYNRKICTNREDYISAIADTIFNGMEKWFPITKEEFTEILRTVQKTKEKASVPLYEELEKGKMEVTSFDCDGKTYYNNELIIDVVDNDFLTIEHSIWGGEATFYYHYETPTIKDEDVAYIVCESFHCPTKGVPVVERLYKPLFDNLADAESYRKELDAKIEARVNKDNYPKSESTLNVINRKEIEATDFYKRNMVANALMEDKEVNPWGDSFRIFVDNHIEILKQL